MRRLLFSASLLFLTFLSPSLSASFFRLEHQPSSSFASSCSTSDIFRYQSTIIGIMRIIATSFIPRIRYVSLERSLTLSYEFHIRPSANYYFHVSCSKKYPSIENYLNLQRHFHQRVRENRRTTET